MRLVLALGSQPNRFGIPGLTDCALDVSSADDAARVNAAAAAAAQAGDPAG
jgi:NADH dehydrogenase FAD-containing subunit